MKTIILLSALFLATSSSASVIGKVKRSRVIGASYTRVGSLNGDCTGTLIGPRHVVTAAHCIYDLKSKKYQQMKYFKAGQNGLLLPGVESPIIDRFAHPKYMNSGDMRYDVAMVILKYPIGEQLGYYPIHLDTNDWNLNPKTLAFERLGTLVGYPGDKFPGTMWYVNCTFGYQVGTALRPAYYCDTFGGMSGSAILVKNKQGKTVISGVHAYGVIPGILDRNSGALFYGDVMTFLQGIFNIYR